MYTVSPSDTIAKLNLMESALKTNDPAFLRLLLAFNADISSFPLMFAASSGLTESVPQVHHGGVRVSLEIE
ncbi:hypothetical protein AAMO2058_001436600 [Amorphochlora amoebiformis]